MDIDLEKQSDLLLGISSLEQTEHGLLPLRFNEANAWDGLEGFMQGCPAGVRISFASDARRLVLTLRLGEAPFDCGRGTVDVLVDGKTIASVTPEAPLKDGQRFVVATDLPSGYESAVVYLPTYRKAEIESFQLEGATFVRAYRPFKERILFIGDSITQGYGSSPADCYAARYARLTHRDFLNLGIGGACMPGHLPETLRVDDYSEVVFAFGTNDANNFRTPEVIAESLGNFVAFMKGRPPRVTIWSPVPWPQGEREGKRDYWCRVVDAIRSFAASHPEIRFVDGARVLPWNDDYFADGTHPNTVGMAMLSHAFC